VNGVGTLTECADCGAKLKAHNVTGLCAECKLIARNRRLTGQPADISDPVSYDDAILNLATILGVRTIWTGAAT
jgi:hypothetical protein